MPPILALVGAAAGFGAGWTSGAFQHQLYRQPDLRGAPASGRKAVLIRVLLAVASALAVALALRPDHYDPLPALLTAGFSVALLTLASTDFERRLLPNRLLYPTLLAAVVLCWAWPDRSLTAIALGLGFGVAAAVAIFACGMLFGGLGFGMGDAKLIVLIGALLGWPAALSGLFFGILLAGVPATALMLSGRGRSKFSYGPYLIAGALIVLLFPDRFV
jgi:leader peptidase (prepilin peptidase)/N-methyltransferase